MKKVSRKQTMTLEDLAVLVAKGFDQQDKKLDEFKQETRENFKKVRIDILEIGDRFVSKHQFDELVSRFNALETRVKTKLK